MDTQKLRQRILDLAIRGKLVPQDPDDEPASVLLDRIRAEKERLIAEGKIKRPKARKSTDKSHYQQFTPPFDIPDSWEWVRLEEIAKIGTGATPSKSNREYYGGNINWVSSSVTSSPYVDVPTDFITELALKETNCEIYPIGTLLMAMYGEGKTRGQVTELRIEAASNQACAAIIPHIAATKNFVKLYLLANYYQLRRLAEGGNQPNLNLGKISSLYIPIPPVQEQQRILEQYKYIIESIELVEKSKAFLEERIYAVKSKVLDLAMQGELVPQDPADEPAADMLRRINPKAKIITDNPHSWNVSANWTVCNLGDTVKIRSAKRVMKSDWRTEGVPFYRTREIVKLSENGIVDNELFISYQLYEEYREKYGIPVAGDIMITAVGTIGKTYIVRHNDKFYYKDASVLCISPYPIISSDFLTYLFRSEYLKKQLMGNSKGTTVDTITIEKANSYTIALPPFNEQKRMVAKIEELYSVLDKIEASLRS